MFLKNESNFQCGLRTKKEVLTIRPGEVVHILDRDILNVNSKLVKVGEKEYEEFIKSNKDEQAVSKVNEPTKTEDENGKSIPDKCASCYADGKTPDEQKCQNCNDAESKKDEEAEKQDEQKSDSEGKENAETIESLEAKLEELKTKWQEATRPNRKEAIQKQIKEVQDKINKLQ